MKSKPKINVINSKMSILYPTNLSYLLIIMCVTYCAVPTIGVTMKLMDEVAGIVAARHCKTNIVTASVDAINFHRKIKKGIFLLKYCTVQMVTIQL